MSVDMRQWWVRCVIKFERGRGGSGDVIPKMCHEGFGVKHSQYSDVDKSTQHPAHILGHEGMGLRTYRGFNPVRPSE